MNACRRCLALLATSALVACTEAARPSSSTAPLPATDGAAVALPPPVPPAAIVPAASDAGAVWSGPLPRFDHWSDPPAVDALVAGAAPSKNDTSDARGCGFGVPDQSCLPGLAGFDWSCKSSCAETCGTCADDCQAQMSTCRRTCAAADGACLHACGSHEGACVDTCLGGRDRCATADCSRQLDALQKEVGRNYGCRDKRKPFAICQRAAACLDACDQAATSDDKTAACQRACRARTVGCDAQFLEIVESRICNSLDDGV